MAQNHDAATTIYLARSGAKPFQRGHDLFTGMLHWVEQQAMLAV